MKPANCQDQKNFLPQGNSSPLYIERGLFVKEKSQKKLGAEVGEIS
jgi:hypothetical protein